MSCKSTVSCCIAELSRGGSMSELFGDSSLSGHPHSLSDISKFSQSSIVVAFMLCGWLMPSDMVARYKSSVAYEPMLAFICSVCTAIVYSVKRNWRPELRGENIVSRIHCLCWHIALFVYKCNTRASEVLTSAIITPFPRNKFNYSNRVVRQTVVWYIIKVFKYAEQCWIPIIELRNIILSLLFYLSYVIWIYVISLTGFGSGPIWEGDSTARRVLWFASVSVPSVLYYAHALFWSKYTVLHFI